MAKEICGRCKCLYHNSLECPTLSAVDRESILNKYYSSGYKNEISFEVKNVDQLPPRAPRKLSSIKDVSQIFDTNTKQINGVAPNMVELINEFVSYKYKYDKKDFNFEKQVKEIIERKNISEISNLNIKQFLSSIEQKVNYGSKIENTIGFVGYCYQPYGSQKFPDFLFFTKHYIYPFEVKKSNSGRVVPNGAFTRGYNIYLFNEKKVIYCFLGEEHVDEEEQNTHKQYYSNVNAYAEEQYFKLYKKDKVYSYKPVPREAYQNLGKPKYNSQSYQKVIKYILNNEK